MVSEMTLSGKKTTTQTQLERTRMRTEVTDATGAKQVVIFDGAKQVMYIINDATKSYTEMTKADLERVAGMMAQMQAQMANLPPAQRAQMESMMRGRGMGAAAEKMVYKRVGSGRATKWTCDRYDGYLGTEKVTELGTEKVTELCTVEPTALGFASADFEVSRQLVEFVRALLPQGADQMFALGNTQEQGGFSGVPVRSVTTLAGQTTTSEVTDVSRQTFPASLFAIPAGFQKQSLGMGGRGF